MLQFDGLSRFCNISHFVSTRTGGVGKGEYASFNLGEWCGDDPAAVDSNRRKLCASIDASCDRLFVPFQTHGNSAVVIDSSFLAMDKAQKDAALHGVDALITDRSGVIIAVSTADCVPVLLYAPDKEVVAAVHAGWRGTVQQIVIRTIERMSVEFGCNPQLLVAGIGPSISQDAFEVGDEVGDAFRATAIDTDAIFYRHPASGKLHIDLWEANRQQLMQAGLQPERIEVAGICTYNHPELFFSARRQGLQSGRMLSGIGIKTKTHSSL